MTGLNAEHRGALGRVLIIGGGMVGLALAQGLMKHGVKCSVFEREACDARPQGWALTITFGIDHLLSLLPPELAARLPDTRVDAEHGARGHFDFLYFDASTGKAVYNMGGRRRLRANRDQLRRLLMEGVDIHWSKHFKGMTVRANGVEVAFTDGTTEFGALVIGADGSGSTVRKVLCPHKWEPHALPINGTGVEVRYTADQLRPVLALDPILFQASDPRNNTFMFYSIMDGPTVDDASDSAYTVQVFLSWPIKDERTDAFAATDAERLQNMRRLTQDWVEPFRGLVADIPDGTPVKALRMYDWVPQEWDNHGGRATLIGDAAHAMTMYRGEAVNHGYADAVNLITLLVRVQGSKQTLGDAIAEYEEDLRERTRPAVLLSRQACLDGHSCNAFSPDSPLVNRTPS